jgi:hypothetical protein
MEYAIASAALFNPSIVPHPNQDGVADGDLRFVMSQRATGEGHLSSIVFRTGAIHADQTVQFDPPRPLLQRLRPTPDRRYVKHLFRRKLEEMSLNREIVNLVLQRVADQFTLNQLEQAIDQALQQQPAAMQAEETKERMRWLANESYQLRLPDQADISQVVIFPHSDSERRASRTCGWCGSSMTTAA